MIEARNFSGDDFPLLDRVGQQKLDRASALLLGQAGAMLIAGTMNRYSTLTF